MPRKPSRFRKSQISGERSRSCQICQSSTRRQSSSTGPSRKALFALGEWLRREVQEHFASRAHRRTAHRPTRRCPPPWRRARSRSWAAAGLKRPASEGLESSRLRSPGKAKRSATAAARKSVTEKKVQLSMPELAQATKSKARPANPAPEASAQVEQADENKKREDQKNWGHSKSRGFSCGAACRSSACGAPGPGWPASSPAP